MLNIPHTPLFLSATHQLHSRTQNSIPLKKNIGKLFRTKNTTEIFSTIFKLENYDNKIQKIKIKNKAEKSKKRLASILATALHSGT